MVLVDHTEGGFVAELVAFLAPYLNGAPASDDLVTKGPAKDLLAETAKLAEGGAAASGALKALVAALCKHTSDLPSEDMLTAYTLMWDIIKINTPAETPQLALELAKLMCRDLVARPEDRPAARLSVLLMLYDRVGKADQQWRYELLLVLVRFLTVSGQLSSLPSPESVEGWLAAWSCKPKERLAVLDACCECALKLASEEVAQTWLLMLLRDLEPADAATLAANSARALAAVGCALRSPTQFQLDDLSNLQAVKALEKEPAHKQTLRLLHIFVSGTLADLAKFEGEHASTLAALRVDSAVARQKMRLLTLVTLAHAAKGAEIPFARVAEAADVPLDGVEELVLDAIAVELLEAHMDELRSVLRVTRCLHRQFGSAQWMALHAELGEWRSTVAAMLEVMGTAPVSV